MKKILLAMALVVLLFNGNKVMANQTNEVNPVVIEEDQTPLANRQPNNDLTVALLIILIGFIPIIGIVKYRNRQLSLVIDCVKRNDDGTFTIRGGYNTLGLKKYNEQLEHSYLVVTRGSAIFLKKLNLKIIKAKEEDAFIAIINDDSEIQWIVGNQKLTINKQIICKRRT